MSNYTRSTNFTAKDALSSGNPSKIILGSEHDAEYDAIATAIATKQDGINTLGTETSVAVADAFSFYDDSAGSHKKITYANLKIGMGTYLMDTEVQQSNSTTPVIAGFAAGSDNQMAGYGNCTEYRDRANVATAWKITPGASHLGTWFLGYNIILGHATTFTAGTLLRVGVTRYNSGGIAQARYYQQETDAGGTQFVYFLGSTIHNISSATDYFTIDSYCSSGNYNVHAAYFWGWRIQ